MTPASLTTSDPGLAPGPAAEPTHAPWPRGVAFLTAVTAGGVSGLAFEPTNLWPLAFVGTAVWLVLLDLAPQRRKPTTSRARPLRSGFALGYGFGLGFYAVTLNWLSVLVAGVGPLLAVALICVEALFFGALGVAVRLVRQLPGWPLWVALCWGAMEFAQGRIPFGGFAWIRLTYSQVDSPLAGFLPFLSVSGVSVLAAGIGALLAWAYLRFQAGDRSTRRRLTIAVAASLVVVGLLGQLARLYDTPVGEGTVTIGMVQGNVDGGSGIEAMGRARSVTNNHLSETVTLMAKARAGTVAMPDFVLWPENSTDIDPLLDARTNATVAAAATLADRPILVGAVMAGPGEDERQTMALWWNPDQTITARYAKQNLVPFGEYIPFRDQLLPVIPLLKLVGAQSVAGTEPGVLPVTLSNGRSLTVGDIICFELAYDQTVREAVRGSEVLVVQSNNATYRGTPQILQQFAMTRVRAMEARRDIVVATTNSVSGHIDARGRVLDRTQEMTSASNSYVVARRPNQTPATMLGGVLDLVIVLGALGSIAFAVALGVRGNAARGRGGQQDAAE